MERAEQDRPAAIEANRRITERRWQDQRVRDERDALLAALRETVDVLEVLRRGHGVEVASACYPALNTGRTAIAMCEAPR